MTEGRQDLTDIEKERTHIQQKWVGWVHKRVLFFFFKGTLFVLFKLLQYLSLFSYLSLAVMAKAFGAYVLFIVT